MINNFVNYFRNMIHGGEQSNSIISARIVHLDPYLRCLHSVQKYKPSLVYDMMESFRALIEDFLLSYHTQLGKDTFEKHGDCMFLKQGEEIEMIKAINTLLDQKFPYVRRNYTKTTKIRTVVR